MSSSDTSRPVIDRAQSRALAIGVVCFVAAIIWGFILSKRPDEGGWTHFFQSYLFAFVFVVAIPLGSLGFLMLHHSTGGWWGLPIRRILEASTRTIWVMAILFIPIVLGISRLYPWWRADEFPDDSLNHFKRGYLHPGFFTVRTIIYFAIWIVLAYLLNKWSAEQDRTGDLILKDRMVSLSAPGLVLWGLTVSAAAIDWVMSLEPQWSSTIYGMVFMVIQALAALSFSIFVLRRLSDHEPLKDCAKPKQLNDLGNLMLAFTLLWTYMSFSQFLIIWAGNLKDEIPWYLVRARGGWGAVAAILLIFHFFVPFFLLLQRRLKRRLHSLARIAGWMLVVAVIDIYWLVVPAFDPKQTGPHFHLLDLLVLIGIGGVWLGAFFGQLKKLPLLPLHDPRFEGVLEHQHGD